MFYTLKCEQFWRTPSLGEKIQHGCLIVLGSEQASRVSSDNLGMQLSKHLGHSTEFFIRLRICCKADPRTPITELHAECKLPKLSTRRKLHVCNFVHKGVHDKSSNNVNQLFQPVSAHHGVATRSSTDTKLNIPVTRLKTCAQNIKIRGALYYNELPGDIRNAPSEACFKNRAKKYLYGQHN